jgi:hypothetical protein
VTALKFPIYGLPFLTSFSTHPGTPGQEKGSAASKLTETHFLDLDSECYF